MCQPGFQLPAPAFCGLRASFGYAKPALPAYVFSCKYPGINASQEQLHPKTDGRWYINTPAASLRWDNSEVCVLHWLREFSMELSSRCWLVAGLGWPKSWLGFPITSNGRTQTNFLASSINLFISCPSHPASFSCSLSGVSFASQNVLGSTFEATASETGLLRVLISYRDWMFGFSWKQVVRFKLP